MPPKENPDCIKCKKKDKVSNHGKEEYWCGRCKIIFDNDPDEGGTHGNDPSRRMEKQETRKPGRR